MIHRCPKGARLWQIGTLAFGLSGFFLLGGGCSADRRGDGREHSDARLTSANNLKQIGLAMYDWADAHLSRFPAAAIYSRDGQPLLSWRVTMLPYLEEQGLYRQFKLDEPWDSPHNIKLLPKMPRSYAPVAGSIEQAEPYTTFYRVFTGPDTPFPDRGHLAIAGFRDGVANTFLVVEAGKAVPWTKPEDLVYNSAGPLPMLGGLFKEGFTVVMANAEVRFAPRTVSEQTLRALITPNGEEILGPDWP